MDFESLYKKYAPSVRRFALFLCGDPAMADDITADTFLRALQTHERIRQPTVKSFLFTIARNACHDLQRRSWRRAELDGNQPDASISAHVRLEQQQELGAVLAALDRLPEMDRTILLMRVLDDMPYEEIAAALDISVAAAKVKVHRARAKLIEARGPARCDSDSPGGET
jgi:RNA polymerase sigma-70 factor (ECF subfamily)